MSCVNRISRTVLLLLSLASTVGFSMDLLTGVSPDLVAFFNAHETLTFKCLTSSQDIPWESVNDDYCDCDDGSDEPGTNACAAGQFYCANQGYEPKFLSSARVLDGICDCCDGSDERNPSLCPNRCKDTEWIQKHIVQPQKDAQVRAKGVADTLVNSLLEEGVQVRSIRMENKRNQTELEAIIKKGLKPFFPPQKLISGNARSLAPPDADEQLKMPRKEGVGVGSISRLTSTTRTTPRTSRKPGSSSWWSSSAMYAVGALLVVFAIVVLCRRRGRTANHRRFGGAATPSKGWSWLEEGHKINVD